MTHKVSDSKKGDILTGLKEMGTKARTTGKRPLLAVLRQLLGTRSSDLTQTPKERSAAMVVENGAVKALLNRRQTISPELLWASDTATTGNAQAQNDQPPPSKIRPMAANH